MYGLPYAQPQHSERSNPEIQSFRKYCKPVLCSSSSKKLLAAAKPNPTEQYYKNVTTKKTSAHQEFSKSQESQRARDSSPQEVYASLKIEPKTSSNSGGVAQRRRLIFNRQDSGLESQRNVAAVNTKPAHIVYHDSSEDILLEAESLGTREVGLLTKRSNPSFGIS